LAEVGGADRKSARGELLSGRHKSAGGHSQADNEGVNEAHTGGGKQAHTGGGKQAHTGGGKQAPDESSAAGKIGEGSWLGARYTGQGGKLQEEKTASAQRGGAKVTSPRVLARGGGVGEGWGVASGGSSAGEKGRRETGPLTPPPTLAHRPSPAPATCDNTPVSTQPEHGRHKPANREEINWRELEELTGNQLVVSDRVVRM